MKAGDDASDGRTNELRERRATERYLDRPSLTGMLALVVLLCSILAGLSDKIATSRSSAGSVWGAGLALGVGAGAAVAGASGLMLRWVRARSRRRSKQARFGLPGMPVRDELSWQAGLLIVALLGVPAMAAVDSAAYLLGYKWVPGVQHPSTLIQMSALGYGTAYWACWACLLAWLTARPYFGLGLQRWRLTLRGHCPGPVRICTRPAGFHDGHETGPCYLAVCDCMWAGHPRPLNEGGAEAEVTTEARRHSPNVQVAVD